MILSFQCAGMTVASGGKVKKEVWGRFRTREGFLVADFFSLHGSSSRTRRTSEVE